MSWDDFYRRRDALDAVLSRAAHDPVTPPTFDPELFADLDELLGALQHRWMRQLTGHLGVALGDERADRVETVIRVWREQARDHAVLRAVLDHHLTDGPAHEQELRLLALTSGLAELTEPNAEIARVGSAFLDLIRTTSAERHHRLAATA